MPKPDFRNEIVVVFQDLQAIVFVAAISICYVIIMSLLLNALQPAFQEACLELKSSCYHAEKCPEKEIFQLIKYRKIVSRLLLLVVDCYQMSKVSLTIDNNIE